MLRHFVRVDGELRWGDTLEQAVAGTDLEATDARSLPFIPAKLSDNAILTAKDPQYRAILRSLPPVERARLELGNWDVQPTKATTPARRVAHRRPPRGAQEYPLDDPRVDKAASLPTAKYPTPTGPRPRWSRAPPPASSARGTAHG